MQNMTLLQNKPNYLHELLFFTTTELFFALTTRAAAIAITQYLLS